MMKRHIVGTVLEQLPIYFFALSLPTSDEKRVEPSRFPSVKLSQKSIYKTGGLYEQIGNQRLEQEKCDQPQTSMAISLSI
jgi:hypothetical protein